MFYTHVAAALLGASAAAFGAWQTQDWRYSGQIASLKTEHATALVKAQADTREVQAAIDAKYQGALNAARNREINLRRERDKLLATSDGLRHQAADAARRLADAPPATVLDYAVAVNTVYDDCRRAYGDMASKATGHAADVRALRDAWPVMQGSPASGQGMRQRLAAREAAVP